MESQNIGERMHQSNYNFPIGGWNIYWVIYLSLFAYLFSSAITDNEKREIKSLLLSQSFKEPVPQIAIQIAVLIGNISRLDYPQDWDEVTNYILMTF